MTFFRKLLGKMSKGTDSREAQPQSPEPSVFIEGYMEHQTEKAILLYDGSNETWIPKSQIISIEDLDGEEFSDESVHICIEIPAWLAEERGMKEY